LLNQTTIEKVIISIGECWYENNVFGLDLKNRSYFGLDETEELRNVYEILTQGEPCKRLITLGDKLFIGKDAADRLLLNDYSCTAEAIVTPSFKYRGILTIYTLKRSLNYPTKVFSTQEKAYSWLSRMQ